MQSDSSSTEDERIKEAIDGEFLTDDLYVNGEKKKLSRKRPQEPPPSLRNQNHEEGSTNPLSVKVTPEFQKYVSNHLSKLLDIVIDDSEILHKHKKLKTKKNVSSGVKLLSSSENYLITTGSYKPTVKIRRYTRENLKDTDYEERAKQVAVSPDWVLSQEETKSWAPCTKGKVEIIKLNDGYKKKHR